MVLWTEHLAGGGKKRKPTLTHLEIAGIRAALELLLIDFIMTLLNVVGASMEVNKY